MIDYIISPSGYRSKFRYGLPDIPLYCKYTVIFTNGHFRRYSITRLDDGCYSLVDFDDFRQRDNHYVSFECAYNGMRGRISRAVRAMEGL